MDFHHHCTEGENESLERFSKLPKVKHIDRVLVESKQFGPRGCAPIQHSLLVPAELSRTFVKTTLTVLDGGELCKGTSNVLWVRTGRSWRVWEIRAHFPEGEALGRVLRTWVRF